MAEKLVSLGAKVNAQTKNGETPLFLTAVRGQFETAESFLRLGAEPDLGQKRTGRTPMHMAALKGYSDIIGLLIEHGAEIKEKDEAGMTPIEYAAKYRNEKAVERLIAAGAQADGFEAEYAGPSYLSRPLESGEAAVWYCGQSGWAIRTRNHFLVFDYIQGGRSSDDPSLANGRIHPAEIQGQNLTVFVTHAHNDHYDPAIFEWSKEIKDTDYYLGQRPPSAPGKDTKLPDYFLMEPRVRKNVAGMEVATIKSTDAGVGFLVRVEGLTIYHAGDHANRTKELEAAFTEEIDFLAKQDLSIDLAFVPITGCGFRDPEAVEKGTYYFLEKLSPKVMFPMHGADNEYLYSEFAQKARRKNSSTYFCCAKNRGDHYFYSDNRIK
jgi:L-ascorbate metabolism protein UlaG (beta-lactamase superfamily)